MKLKAVFTNNIFLRSIFAASLFILIFISGITYRSTVSLTHSMEMVVHSYKVNTEAEKLFSNIKDAEAGQRGYIITGDSAFLEPYLKVRELIDTSFAELENLTADNHQQQLNLKFLNQLVNLRFEQYDLSLKFSSARPANFDVLKVNMRKGYDITRLIQMQISKIIDLENRNLASREEKFEFRSVFAPVLTLALLLFSLLVFVLSYLKINSDLEDQKRSNKKLLISTESMKHAETIGEFFISQWDLNTNKLKFSDNLYTLLGCEPQSFEPTIENFMQYIHPDDREMIAGSSETNLNNVQTYPHTYRIIRKDGGLRYLKAMGKFITDNKGNKTHISVARDITQYQLSNMALEKRNLELEQSINELESFNHVAGHDLQEPLRKIQIFLSRISENEADTLNENSRDYIRRIQVSVNRMRELIDNLLLYSRANKADKIFERSDLNQLFANTLQELSQIAEEKNAVIEAAKLPTLKVIPFQIQQLFYNLLSNSLKYNQPGIAPHIKIECKKVKATVIPNLSTESGTSYYKFSLCDNGLGFDQQYAEKVFLLFNRLHNSSEYHGTGIGLSICKKIVENHTGIIMAESTPGKGSTFIFYLPE